MDSTFYLFIGAFAFALMFFGLASGKRIYNLFSSGVFLFLAIQLSTYTAMLIVLIGLIIFQLYDTFFGGSRQ